MRVAGLPAGSRLSFVAVDAEGVAAAIVKASGSDPEPAPAGHTCRCGACDPALEIPEGPIGPGHFAVSWPAQHALNVFKVGEQLHDCYQVVAGAPGMAWRFRMPAHVCSSCGKGACAYIDLGEFTVSGLVP